MLSSATSFARVRPAALHADLRGQADGRYISGCSPPIWLHEVCQELLLIPPCPPITCAAVTSRTNTAVADRSLREEIKDGQLEGCICIRKRPILALQRLLGHFNEAGAIISRQLDLAFRISIEVVNY